MNLLSALKSVRLFQKKEKLIPLSTVWGENLDPDHVLEEYPRPQLVRGNYTILNGMWDYTLLSKKNPVPKITGRILVPFSPEAPLSGVGRQLFPGEVLLCTRSLPAECLPQKNERCLLHFGAVDQYARVCVNDRPAISHLGGYLPFSVDITDLLKESDNKLSVYIEDTSDRGFHSTGKQKLRRGGMFYTAQSGIWQTVWTECVPQVHIHSLKLTPHFDKETVHVSLKLNQPLPEGEDIFCHVRDAEGMIISRGTCSNHADSLCDYSCYCDVSPVHPWTPDHPCLYTVQVSAGKDRVTGYFAMRIFTIEPDSGGIPRFCLNHEPLFLQGILDQGYWPDGLYTAPSDQALIYDIQTMKQLGFNLIRKHAKLECARWYYHCDRLGMIVWQDMVNGGGYHPLLMTWLPTLFPFLQSHFPSALSRFLGRKQARGREEFEKECRETIRTLSVFPCISTWVLFNEGWGQFHTERLTALLKALDPERLVDSASGWFDKGCGGYACAIQNHCSTRSVYGYRKYESVQGFQKAFQHLTEQEIPSLVRAGLCGTVYTQLSDIEEETNGLLTYDRKICKLRPETPPL